MLGVPCVLAAAGFLLVTVHAMTAAHIVGWLFVAWITYRLLAAALRHAGADTTLRALLLAGLVLRAAGAVAKYVVSQRAYDGSADAFRYGEEAAIVARRMQSHLVLPGDFHFHRRGTDFVTWVVALLYRTFGPHLILATAVFTLAAFAGTCCLLRVGADCLGRRPLRVFAALGAADAVAVLLGVERRQGGVAGGDDGGGDPRPVADRQGPAHVPPGRRAGRLGGPGADRTAPPRAAPRLRLAPGRCGARLARG